MASSSQKTDSLFLSTSLLTFSHSLYVSHFGIIIEQAVWISSAKWTCLLLRVDARSDSRHFITRRRSEAFFSYSLFLDWPSINNLTIVKLSRRKFLLSEVWRLMILLLSAFRKSLFSSSLMTSLIVLTLSWIRATEGTFVVWETSVSWGTFLLW